MKILFGVGNRPRHSGRLAWWAGLAGLLLTLSLAGCGGGSSGSSSNSQSSSGTGTAAIGLTDAPGDFVTYTVNVTSIKLVRADGSSVETLPQTAQVDFARYTDMSEFLSAAAVPLGAYKQAILTLDYSNADIQVEGNNGNAVPVTQILDSNGNPATTLQVPVQLGNGNITFSLGLPRYFMLDFNLAASNTVTLSSDGSSASITVKPVLVATVDKDSSKLHRLRGPLKSVDVANGSYDVYIRPFFHRMLKNTHTYGEFHVQTSSSTVFEIDGMTYSGSDGLQVLANEAQYTAVVAIGHLLFNPLRFVADEVHAGSSVPGGDMDVVKGSVVARNGDTVILRGATMIRTDGTVVFNDDVMLTLDASTTVTKEFATGTHTIGEISVGQRLTAFGTVTNDSASNMQFSAVNGYVRMELSQVNGSVTTVQTNPTDLVLNLTAINGRDPAIYDFSGTQASATAYDVDPGTLDVSSIAANSSLKVRGFPVPFGSGPMDFTAQTLIQ